MLNDTEVGIFWYLIGILISSTYLVLTDEDRGQTGCCLVPLLGGLLGPLVIIPCVLLYAYFLGRQHRRVKVARIEGELR